MVKAKSNLLIIGELKVTIMEMPSAILHWELMISTQLVILSVQMDELLPVNQDQFYEELQKLLLSEILMVTL